MTAGQQLLIDRIRDATSDEYVIEVELGRGGMSVVYLGRDIVLDRRVAIKVMLPDLVGVAGLQDRFVVEARTAAGLDHPGIVTVYAVKQRAGLTFIVMKYIEGETLDHVLATRGALDSAEVVAIGRHVAEALHFAHSQGVVHRDIKPSNIIIDTHGRPVVTDFGIAKVSTEPALTLAGTTIGTPGYMSPEQCCGLPVNAASDQYSLGVLLYELLTGRPPFSGTLYELLKAHVTDPPPSIVAIRPDVDPALEAIIATMLAKNAADRFPSLEDLSKALLSLGTGREQAVERQPIETPVVPEFVDFGNGESRNVEPAIAQPPTPADVAIEEVVPASPIAAPTSPRPARRGLVATAVVATALVASIGYAVASRRGNNGPAPQSRPPAQAGRVDSVAPPKPADSIAAVAAESSAVAHADSASSAKADSAATHPLKADTTAKQSPAAASKSNASTKTPAPKPSGLARDSAGRIRADSAEARCAALNLKFSLGEEVTKADTIFLKQECPKHRARPPQL